MLSKKDLRKLHTNQRLLVEELQSRGIDVQALPIEAELLEAEYKGHRELILDRDSSINPYAASVLSGNKYITKKLLKRQGLSVTEGEQFTSGEIDEALDYAQSRIFPLVVKPVFGSHGDNVHMDLENLCQVKEAIDAISRSANQPRGFLIEEQFEGKEYRVFITKNKDYAVLHRDPAHVIGDGKRTIEQIAKDESKMRMHPRTTCLCPITVDEIARKYLARKSLDLNFIPKNGEKVYLRHNSNVAAGATCEDYTEKVHPSVISLAKEALEAFPGLPYAGVDFMSKDITRVQMPNNYIILEVNSVPGIHMHMRPGSGKPRNVAKYIANMMFPETKAGEC